MRRVRPSTSTTPPVRECRIVSTASTRLSPRPERRPAAGLVARAGLLEAVERQEGAGLPGAVVPQPAARPAQGDPRRAVQAEPAERVAGVARAARAALEAVAPLGQQAQEPEARAAPGVPPARGRAVVRPV